MIEKPGYNMERQEKETIWHKTLEGLAGVGDRLGYRIDEGIKETVVAFKVNGFPTYGSCEGHIEKRFGKQIKLRPYIDIGFEEPKLRYVDEQIIREKIASESNIPIESIDEDESARRAFWDYIDNHDVAETPEYMALRAKNEHLQKSVADLLQSFYKNSGTPEDLKLVIERIGPAGHFRVTNAKEDPDEVMDKDLEKFEKQLSMEQEEMQRFTLLFKNRFFSEGQSL
jgi:hypothetical protein